MKQDYLVLPDYVEANENRIKCKTLWFNRLLKWVPKACLKDTEKCFSGSLSDAKALHLILNLFC